MKKVGHKISLIVLAMYQVDRLYHSLIQLDISKCIVESWGTSL